MVTDDVPPPAGLVGFFFSFTVKLVTVTPCVRLSILFIYLFIYLSFTLN